MKKLILSAFSVILFTSCFAQKTDVRKGPMLGVSFFLNDFQTAADIKRNGLSNVFISKNLFKSARLNPGFAISYLQGIFNHADFSATLGGSFVNYTTASMPTTTQNKFLLEASSNFNLKLVNDDHWVIPFADFGIGISKYNLHYAAFIPTGIGFQINLFDEAFIVLNSQYRFAVTEFAAPHLYHSFGIYSNIGKKKADRQ
ncbi:MAG: hypothetical protein M3004_06540 [Bacteroidota bacterium]|nr:hypothetical protein [Bacteroidota bacterium]